MDRTKALYGPRTQAYGETNYLKEKIQVLDRTKALYGPQTQAYGETNYLKEKIQVLDRTKPMGKPTILKENTEFWTPPERCMAYGLCPMEGLPINNWVNP